MGIPVIISPFGFPVRQVEGGAPLMTVSSNGLGFPIMLSDRGFPFIVEGVTPPVPLPGSISDLSVLSTTTSTAALAFTDAENATSHQYRLDGGAASTLASNKIVTGLTAETTYDVEVRGMNDAGDGEWSNVAEIVTQAVPIEADFYMMDGGTGDGLTPETAGSFATVWAAAADDDVIALVGNTTVPRAHTWSKSVTITAAKGPADADPLGTGHTLPCRFERKYDLIFVPPNIPAAEPYSGYAKNLTTVGAGKTITFGNVRLTFPYWPGENEIWEDIGVAQAANWFLASGAGQCSLVFDGAEIFHGYGPNQAVYDPSEKLYDFTSPDPWYGVPNGYGRITDTDPGGATAYSGWGDAEFKGYNTPFHGPVVVGNGNWKDIIVNNTYVHDLREFSKIITQNPDSRVIVTNSWFERLIGDYLRVDLGNYTTDFTGEFTVTGNVMLDPIGHQWDASNPHVDYSQLYASRPETVTANATRVRNINHSNNFWAVSRPDSRSSAQAHYWQTTSSQTLRKAVLDYGSVRNSMLVGGIHYGVVIPGARDPYIRNSTIINPTWWPDLGQQVNGDIELHNSDRNENTVYEQTTGMVWNTVVQNIVGNLPLRENAVITGQRGATIPHVDIFVDPSDPEGPIKPGALYAKYRTKGEYASHGPQYETLYDLLTAGSDYTGEEPHIGFVDLVGQSASTQVTSNMFYLHGGDVGDAIACTLPTGVEMQQYAVDRSTIAEAWTSTPTCAVGNYAQLRATSPSSGSDTHDIVYGGVTFSWSIEVSAAETYLIADGSNYFSDPNSLPAGTTELTFSARVSLPADRSNCKLFGQTSSGCDMEVFSNGNIRLVVEDSTGAKMINFAGVTGANIAADTPTEVTFHVSMIDEEAVVTLDGTPYPVAFTATGTGEFATSSIHLLAQDSNGTAAVSAGTEFSDLTVLRNGAAYKSISNIASEANADDWKQPVGSNEFTQGGA